MVGLRPMEWLKLFKPPECDLWSLFQRVFFTAYVFAVAWLLKAFFTWVVLSLWPK